MWRRRFTMPDILLTPLAEQELIERAIDRYRAKYPRLFHPQPSKHKSYIADGRSEA